MSTHVWGDEETQFFFALTPERVLAVIESSLGVHCTGRVMALNSMENRVYEVELELDERPKHPSDRFVIAKFYRPGRWSRQQILDEHEFLADLKEAEIPAIAPLPFQDGTTLHQMMPEGLFYTCFPKRGGRAPDELSHDDAEQVGRLIARMHLVGASKEASHRIHLDTESYGLENLQFLKQHRHIPPHYQNQYEDLVLKICDKTRALFQQTPKTRIHGDAHLGNLLRLEQAFYWIDFDDMVMGPKVQDLWLIIPGRDEYAQGQLRSLLSGYESLAPFDHATLALIEPLRALRFIHFSAWIAKRWDDPAFPRAFPAFGTDNYWREQIADLGDQWELIRDSNL